MAGYEDEPSLDDRARYRGRFRVLDQSTGEPVGGRVSQVRSTSGQAFSASTDAEGYTAWVECDADELLSFKLIESGNP